MHTFAHLYFFNHSNEQKVLDGLFFITMFTLTKNLIQYCDKSQLK